MSLKCPVSTLVPSSRQSDEEIIRRNLHAQAYILISILGLLTPLRGTVSSQVTGSYIAIGVVTTPKRDVTRSKPKNNRHHGASSLSRLRIVHQLLDLRFRESMHGFQRARRRRRWATRPLHVNLSLIRQPPTSSNHSLRPSPFLKTYKSRSSERTTGTSNSYTSLHCRFPGAITSTSANSNGRLFHTEESTLFALSHRPQLARVKSVICVAWRRRA
jgi:hypothetical protein